MSPSELLILGLPDSGKSSFIQAVDEALKHAQDADDLCFDGLSEDRSYLNEGKLTFLAGDPLERTKLHKANTSVELLFAHRPSGKCGRLILPDEKGETFKNHWIDRRWEAQFEQRLENISGVLMFVHADAKARNDERLGILARSFGKPDQEVSPWSLGEASTQVQMVELLQFIAEHPRIQFPLRSAVLISAWDTVENAKDSPPIRPQDPAIFLSREWPLLSQYLSTNPEAWTTKIFGVSAYGGVPGKLADEVVSLQAHERSKLKLDAANFGPVTTPLKWMLRID